jgi:hypothetical protein
MPAIEIGSNCSVRLSNVNIRGFDVGIKAASGASIEANNLRFDNVRLPFDIPGKAESSVQGTRITNDPKLKEQSRGKSYIGWSRPHGPALPALCPNCKTIFPSQNYNFGSSRFYSRDNEETCPHCHFEHAKLSDGLFDLTGEAVKALNAPDITHAMLVTIHRIADAVMTDELTHDQAIAEIEKVRPSLANYLSKAHKLFGPTGMTYLTFALGIAALLYAHIQTSAALESRDLAREQTQIAREALKLQREQPGVEKILEKIADSLAGIKFTLKAQIQSHHKDNTSHQSKTQPKVKPNSN